MKALLVLVLCGALGSGCVILLTDRSRAKQKAEVEECKERDPTAECATSPWRTVGWFTLGLALDTVVAGIAATAAILYLYDKNPP